MSTGLARAIADIYRQVEAPSWATPNLDALADVLRDLGWRAPGAALVRVPATGADHLARLLPVLMAAEAETAGSARPVHILVG